MRRATSVSYRLHTFGSAAGVSVALAVVMVTGLAASASPVRSTRAHVDWKTYGFDLQRTGYNPAETVLGVGTVGQLHPVWSTNLGAPFFDSATFAANVPVQSGTLDLIYVGTEGGGFFALNAADGRVVWQRDLGIGHGGVCGTLGVSSGSVCDRTAGTVYVVGGDDRAYALDMATGVDQPGWPVVVTGNQKHEHVWSSLTLANGLLYVPVASYCDAPPYHGRVVAFDATTGSRRAVWYVTGRNGPSGGGIWGWGGVSVDTGGDVYAATGNSLSNPEHYGYAEHVVRLDSGLKVKAANYPGLLGGDVDFGATPTLYQVPGCAPQLVVKNKDGQLFLYDRDGIASGPIQRITMADFTVDFGSFLGSPAYSPVERMVFVTNSSDSPDGTYKHGVVALSVQSDCTLALAWQRAVGVNADVVPPPSAANGVVYVADGSNPALYAFAARTGLRLWDSGQTIAGGFACAPIVVNGHVYVGSLDGIFHAFGL